MLSNSWESQEALPTTPKWFWFPKGTTYLLARNTGTDQWTIISLRDASARSVRYSVDEYISWTDFVGQILGPLIIDTIEQILSEHTGFAKSPTDMKNILTIKNWYAFWLPDNKQKASVAIYYDNERWLSSEHWSSDSGITARQTV